VAAVLSRRNFVKGLAAVLAAAGGGASLWQVWRQHKNLTAAAPPLLEGRTPLLSFFLLSDIHLAYDDSSLQNKLRTALADITHASLPVDTLVLGGDLVEGGRDGDYKRLKEILSAYKLPPLYGNMGNHEYYDIWYNAQDEWTKDTVPNGKTDAQARERFMRFLGQDLPYRSVWVNGVHLIMLSQEAYVQERPEVGEGAWHSDAQLAWFAQEMQAHADGKPAFVFIHQPLPPDGEEGGSHRFIRNKEFRAILKPYRNVFVLSGHTHRNLESEGHYVQDTTFHWFQNASVGKTRGIGSAPNPVQGLYIQVYPDEVVVLGREFSNRTWIKAAEWTIKLQA
jgi:3',5'-cyclic AMP phosphodiesterase CpdA